MCNRAIGISAEVRPRFTLDLRMKYILKRTPNGLRLFRQQADGIIVPCSPAEEGLGATGQNWLLASWLIIVTGVLAFAVGPPGEVFAIFGLVFAAGALVALAHRRWGAVGGLVLILVVVTIAVLTGLLHHAQINPRYFP